MREVGENDRKSLSCITTKGKRAGRKTTDPTDPNPTERRYPSARNVENEWDGTRIHSIRTLPPPETTKETNKRKIQS